MYNLGIHLLSFVLKVLAHFNTKIKLGVLGRQSTFEILSQNLTPIDKTIWFHCASLGEYEQGLPVFECVRHKFPQHKIILTFFSPSGYEIRKNTKIADIVVYLPLDTTSNAERFISVVKPELTIFVKYDIWPNFLHELKKQGRTAYLISALFRKNQSFFKFYGRKTRSALFAFKHIFVQNKSSELLLKNINYNNVTVTGDTRFDRVTNQLSQDNTLDFISEFKDASTCIVIGSSWAEDEAILIPYINANASETIKFIIAPHEIDGTHIKSIRSKLEVKTAQFSEKEGKSLKDYSVFIIDTIGLLTKIYNYANIAYVGGAMGKTGLHNILEPAVFGIPVIIGKNYKKFPEASAMIEKAGVISVKNDIELKTVLDTLLTSTSYRKSEGLKNARYIGHNKGAVVQIMDTIRI
ncbi:3-deoxy-D-manno-octulosonic acid transferase [Psychroserpens sp.]|uniref:3-deoxy-D-manno-octulosonic acid transferase n=1 Tax=Psychroserpens sp. TaxID=2020870 RepID=UPI003C780821